MDELRRKLSGDTPLGNMLRRRNFSFPRGGGPAALESALKAALGHHGSVGAARIGALGLLEPAASGEGLGWGRDAWDALERAPIDDDIPGLVIRFTDGEGRQWRYGLDFATGAVSQIPKIFRMGGR